MLFCKISYGRINVESDEEFIVLCLIILIMLAIAALMDIFKKPKKSDSVDVEITIKIKCGNEKTSLEEAH